MVVATVAVAATLDHTRPKSIAVAPDGSYFVIGDWDNNVWWVAHDDTMTIVATLNRPYGITVDRWGSAFTTEPGEGRVRKIARGAGGGWVVSTVVTMHAGLWSPWGIAVDPAGHLVVADMGHERVVRINPATGAITVLAGDGTRGFRDGPGATACFKDPSDVVVDRRGDIFVADSGNDRVRRISGADRTVTTVAGTGDSGSADGGGLTAQFCRPQSVAVDGRGVLLVGDGDWNEFRLRRVAASADRTVTTVACEGGDGVGSKIYSIAIDHDGTLLLTAPHANRALRVTGLGLVPPSAPPGWSLRAHRGLAAAVPAVGRFVTTVMLCALRLDTNADADGVLVGGVPRLPVEMWLAILSMLRPDQMLPQRRARGRGDLIMAKSIQT